MGSSGRRFLARLSPAALVFALSCSPAGRDRLARFFFDAPPPTGAPAEAALAPSRILPAPVSGVVAARSFASIHPPFLRRRCGDCHDAASGQALLQPRRQRCVSCHATVLQDKAVLHGPIAARACGECHLPHASPLPALLRQPEPHLCLICHAPSWVRNDSYHADLAIGCTICHDPHGAADARLLRPEAIPAQGRWSGSTSGAGLNADGRP